MNHIMVLSRCIMWCMVVSVVWTALFLTAPAVVSGSEFMVDEICTVRNTRAILPSGTEQMTRLQCMKCHPLITNMLRKAGAAHGGVECRQCHLKFHVYEQGVTNYESLLPKCSRCHGHPHGEELTDCSSCHVEAHSPLEIPASLSLAQGCYVCHQELDREIKTFITQHTELYCTACHHTKHGHIPSCLECHLPHCAIFPARIKSQEPAMPRILDDCLACHPPHSALNVVLPDGTANRACALCHREAYDVLEKSGTKHSALQCTRCHPGKHRTIKRCRECHGEPHPAEMLRQAGPCGSCHGVAHSIMR